MKRHVVDGAHILRRTPEMPALAPIVAFEHHLKQDLSGYPGEHRQPEAEPVHDDRQRSPTCSTRCAATARTARGWPPTRIRAIMGEQGNPAFNQTLLKRFVNLMGLFPGRQPRAAEHRRARGRHRRAPDRSVPAAGEDHHGRDGRDARGAAARQHVGARRAAASIPRAVVEAVDPESVGHRSAAVPVTACRSPMADVDRPPRAARRRGRRAADRLRARVQGRRARGRALSGRPPGHRGHARTHRRRSRRPAALPRPLRLTVLPDGLLLDDRAPARPDAGARRARRRCSTTTSIGEMTVHPGGDADAWRDFLLLLAPLARVGPRRRRHRARLDDDGRPARRAARDRLRRSAARARRRRCRPRGNA